MASRSPDLLELDWSKHITAQKQSGLSRAEYCRRYKLSYDNFQYHLKRHLKRHQQAKTVVKNAGKDTSIRGQSDVISFKVEPAATDSQDAPPIELSLQLPGQNLTLKAYWSTAQLLEFITAWRAL
jgi:hypothetical protein